MSKAPIPPAKPKALKSEILLPKPLGLPQMPPAKQPEIKLTKEEAPQEAAKEVQQIQETPQELELLKLFKTHSSYKNTPRLLEAHAQEIASWFLQNREMLDTILKNGERPIHIAAEMGSIQLVQLLIDAGADIASLNQNGHNVLNIACQTGNLDLLKIVAKGQGKIIDNLKQIATSSGSMAPVHYLNALNTEVNNIGASKNALDSFDQSTLKKVTDFLKSQGKIGGQCFYGKDNTVDSYVNSLLMTEEDRAAMKMMGENEDEDYDY